MQALLALLKFIGSRPQYFELVLMRALKAPPWEESLANNITMARARIGFWGIHGLFWPYAIGGGIVPNAHIIMWGAFAALVISAALDSVDGIVARRTGRVTEFGRFADPFADKTIAWSAFCVLLYSYGFALWLVLVAAGVVLYDVAVSIERAHNSAMRTNRVAKLKQWPLDIGVGALIINVLVPTEWVATTGQVCLLLALVLCCISAFIYYRTKLCLLCLRLAAHISHVHASFF